MQCPTCGTHMNHDHNDTKTAPDGITYNQEILACGNDECGTWVTVEVPKK